MRMHIWNNWYDEGPYAGAATFATYVDKIISVKKKANESMDTETKAALDNILKKLLKAYKKRKVNAKANAEANPGSQINAIVKVQAIAKHGEKHEVPLSEAEENQWALNFLYMAAYQYQSEIYNRLDEKQKETIERLAQEFDQFKG